MPACRPVPAVGRWQTARKDAGPLFRQFHVARDNCSEPVRPRADDLHEPTSLPSSHAVEIFSLYGCGKILLHGWWAGQVVFGRLQSFRRWAGNQLALLRSHPALAVTSNPTGQTCSVQPAGELQPSKLILLETLAL